ncbi:hypothetical protein E2C01_009128 [Portunus trituberculatus]|uniref:Uncharacterized protein n=1 Tax=Portunus trituberculatus TaxID=210409 RepID=A0A5B7D2M6_PORTR|nr:hypothetical protein [Portunus trituberculatus]
MGRSHSEHLVACEGLGSPGARTLVSGARTLRKPVAGPALPAGLSVPGIKEPITTHYREQHKPRSRRPHPSNQHTVRRCYWRPSAASVYHTLNKCFRRASAASWWWSHWLRRPLERAEPQKGKRGRGPLLGTQSHEHQVKTRPGRCGQATIYNSHRRGGSEGFEGTLYRNK